MAGKELNIKIAGEAGQGINVSALTLARAYTRKGLFAFLLTDNPNSIKLEHTWCSVRLSEAPVYCQGGRVDVLVALSRDSVQKRQAEVAAGGFVVYDAQSTPLAEEEKRQGVEYYSVPFDAIIAGLKAPPILRNTVAVGAMLGLLCYPLSGVEALIEEQFQRKGKDVVGQNLQALKAGHEYVQKNFSRACRQALKAGAELPRMFLNGNEALSAGAILAGMKFLSAYPMTPASGILHYVADKAKEFNIVVKHTEDELAAALMAVGASYAGVRSMTCTSGGGFCLMTESLGFAAQSETPFVVALGQRPGPATGQPTHTAQGDLQFALHASQGEFPRIVVAPGDPQECFREGFNAFNLAERFQVPVIIMTDKYLGESYSVVDEFDRAGLAVDRGKLIAGKDAPGIKEYKRYALADDGVSPRAIPGSRECIHLATSYEHADDGYYLEDPQGVVRMIDKKFLKVARIKEALPRPVLYGPKEAPVTLVSWGSNKPVILEAIEALKAEGITANLLHMVYVWPFPAEAVAGALGKAKMTVCIEANRTGQLADLIREQTGIAVGKRLLKYDGQPFYPAQVCAWVKEACGK